MLYVHSTKKSKEDAAGIGATAQPPMVACKMEAQMECTVYVLHTRFCTFGADLHAKSVLLSKKKFLHRSSVGSLLRARVLVGCMRGLPCTSSSPCSP